MRARLVVTAGCLAAAVGIGVGPLASVAAGVPTPGPTPSVGATVPPSPTPGPSASPAAQSIRGTLLGPNRRPVAGVRITVSQHGDKVGSARTAKDGTWQVGLDQPGSYDVSLRTSSLPEGVVLRNPAARTLHNVLVTPGQARTVIFPLVPAGQQGTTAGPSRFDRILQAIADGVKFGAIIAITAVGLSLLFGTTRLINFAHGEMVTIGAVVAYWLNASGPHWQLVPAAVVAIAVGSLVGLAIDVTVWRPLRGRGTGLIQMFIITIGLSLFLRHLILIFFGSRQQQYVDFTSQRNVDLGPISIAPRDLTIIGLSLVVLIGVALLLQYTRIGTAMRAVADNRDLAEASGIDVARVVRVVWMVAGALAALGGVFYGLTAVVRWDMGFNLLLLMFAGVILGGLGSAYGAVVGSFVVGIVAQLSTVWFSAELQNAWALGALIVVLLLRPQGILGRRARIG